MTNALQRRRVLAKSCLVDHFEAGFANVTGGGAGLDLCHAGSLRLEVDVEEPLGLWVGLAYRGHAHHVAPVGAVGGACIDHDQVAGVELLVLERRDVHHPVLELPGPDPDEAGSEIGQARKLGKQNASQLALGHAPAHGCESCFIGGAGVHAELAHGLDLRRRLDHPQLPDGFGGVDDLNVGEQALEHFEVRLRHIDARPVAHLHADPAAGQAKIFDGVGYPDHRVMWDTGALEPTPEPDVIDPGGHARDVDQRLGDDQDGVSFFAREDAAERAMLGVPTDGFQAREIDDILFGGDPDAVQVPAFHAFSELFEAGLVLGYRA